MQHSLIFIYNYWIISFYFKVDHLAVMITVALKLGISPQKLQKFNPKMHSQTMHSQQTTCKMGDLCHVHKQPRLKSLNHLTHLRKDPFYSLTNFLLFAKVYFMQTEQIYLFHANAQFLQSLKTLEKPKVWFFRRYKNGTMTVLENNNTKQHILNHSAIFVEYPSHIK